MSKYPSLAHLFYRKCGTLGRCCALARVPACSQKPSFGNSSLCLLCLTSLAVFHNLPSKDERFSPCLAADVHALTLVQIIISTTPEMLSRTECVVFVSITFPSPQRALRTAAPQEGVQEAEPACGPAQGAFAGTHNAGDFRLCFDSRVGGGWLGALFFNTGWPAGGFVFRC